MNLNDALNDKKAALYIRVSTHWQVDKDSLPLQENDLINYAKYALGVEKYEVFKDAGYSAKNTNRPDYQRMMARLRTGEFTHLIVWKIDRISRNLLDFAQMYNELKQLGITFVSKNEQFDTSTAMGEAMLKIILVFAELERNITSERVTAIMLSRANEGKWNGGHVPFGYDYDKTTKILSVNPTEAITVNMIYDTYEETRSLIQVAKFMNESKHFPRSGKAWNPVTVGIILNNPFYSGDYLYNKHDEKKSGGNASTSALKKESEWILVKDHHPPIIERERQQAIKMILQSQRRSNKGGPRTYTRVNTHIFAGLLKCGKCGNGMPSTIDRVRGSGYRPSIYMCSRRRRFNDCDNKYISDVKVGPFVLNYISNVIKAQNNFGKTTDIATFERKLLRGSYFEHVESIERIGLQDMYNMLKTGKWQTDEYTLPDAITAESLQDETALLSSERRKKERALARLKSLYLYGEETIPETEYLIERKQLDDAIKQIDERLAEIEKVNTLDFSLSDEEFLSKASYFIMSQQLLTKRYVDFEKLIKKLDPKIIKTFINSIVKKIVISDGKILSICFKNGIEHKFLYKQGVDIETEENL
ncbi:MAG: recombinase family protein [Clostridia bacterium]|nr:recombinase family protein [Clostridia bacterium]